MLTACAEAVSSAPCGAYDLAECEVPLGNLADGAPCWNDEQCASSRCEYALGNDAADCGSCRPLATAGESCLVGSDCASRLECVSMDSTAYVCAKRAAVGEACQNSNDCVAGLRCVDGQCAQRLGAGESCDPAVGGCNYDFGLQCTADGICAALPLAGTGEACGWVNNLYVDCLLGYCGRGACSPYVAEGQPCTTSVLCEAGSTCLGGKCVPIAPVECATPTVISGGLVLDTTQGPLTITDVEVPSTFPPGCTAGATCNTASSGYQMVVVWLEQQGGDIEQLSNYLTATFSEATIAETTSGSVTNGSGAGLVDSRLFVLFTPLATEKSWLFTWPGNAPVQLPTP
jgi:hypothetical protein